jgi:RNA recognition motif. (a.k.a. RRM, RBD, or RNP domain)
VTLALSIIPTAAFIAPQDPWWILQWKWLQQSLRHGPAGIPVTISPILLYLGLVLSVIGVALRQRGEQEPYTASVPQTPSTRKGYDMQIFVGNLAYTTTDQELRQAFEAYGTVDRVHIPQDRDTGRPRGFGFVEMPDPTEAQAAIEGLNGTSLGGRTLNVSAAREREERGGPRRLPQERRPRW